MARLNPISDRQKLRNGLYRPAVRRWLKRIGPVVICAVCWSKALKTPHHIIPRSVIKDLEAVEENFLPVCFSCHLRIHSEPAWAYENGYMGRSHEKLSEIAARREHRTNVTAGLPL